MRPNPKISRQLLPYMGCFAFLLFGYYSRAQQPTYITGKLMDATTKEPVVFANIRIKDRALGVISNEDGSFRIPLRYKQLGDILEISSLGYRTREIPMASLSEERLNPIQLIPGTIVLDEAIVRGEVGKRKYSARDIVKMAIEAIPENYPTQSFSTVGYYRDYQQKDGDYINLNEAILAVFDQGFDRGDFSTTEVQIFHSKRNSDFPRDSLAAQKYDYSTGSKVIDKAHLENYEGNEFTNLRIHDALRNFNAYSYDFVGNLETDFLVNHKFKKGDATFSDEEALYVIHGIGQRPGYRAHAKLFISKGDFAIHKMEYTLYDSSEKNTIRKKNKHGHKHKLIFDVVLEYARIQEKMYLNYISFHNAFLLHLPPVFALTDVGLSLTQGYFGLKFNRQVDSLSAGQPNNYTITFKGSPWQVGKIRVYGDSLHIYPKVKAGTLANAMREVDAAVNKRTFNKDWVDVQVRNLKDVDGNIIHVPRVENYLQFREFFVQRVQLETRAPFDIRFMDKRKPIFEGQPVEPTPDYLEYWMNTPLQTTIH